MANYIEREFIQLLRVKLADEDKVKVSSYSYEWFDLNVLCNEVSVFPYLLENFLRSKYRTRIAGFGLFAIPDWKTFDANKYIEAFEKRGYHSFGSKIKISPDFDLEITGNSIIFNNVLAVRFFCDKNVKVENPAEKIVDLAESIAERHVSAIKTWKTLLYEHQDKILKKTYKRLLKEKPIEDVNIRYQSLRSIKSILEGKKSEQFDLNTDADAEQWRPVVEQIYHEQLKKQKQVNITDKTVLALLRNAVAETNREYDKDDDAIRIKMPGRRYVEFKFDKNDALKTKQFFEHLDELEALLKLMPRTTINYYGPKQNWQKGSDMK